MKVNIVPGSCFILLMLFFAISGDAAGPALNISPAAVGRAWNIETPASAPVPAASASVPAPASGLTGKDSALCAAAWEGDAAKTAELINSGADMNAVCGSGWSVLYTAVSQSHFEVVERLAELGARIKGVTPLQIAIRKGYEEMASLLKYFGATMERMQAPPGRRNA